MDNLTQKRSFKVVTLILAIILLIPSAVKLSHAFSHHSHEVCKGEVESHIHKVNLDCDFYKFKLNTPFTLHTDNYNFFSIVENHAIVNTQYDNFSDYQQLIIYLRGPPRIV